MTRHTVRAWRHAPPRAALKLPYYVIQGRHDLFAPTPLVERYFRKVSAPKKRVITIEDAGHFALATHQPEVIAALKAVIR